MGIGIGAFLLAVGLVLALAVQDSINNVDLSMVGWILAGVGVLALVIGTIQMTSARRSEHRVIEDKSIHTD